MGNALQAWIDRLRALAREGGVPPEAGIADARAFVGGFRDEMGHRRDVDALLLTGALRRRGHQITGAIRQNHDSPVLALWARAIDGAGSAGMRGSEAVPAGLCEHPPLLARDAFGTIEVWSESLLSALHALSWIVRDDEARTRGTDAWTRERLWHEARWIIEHLEPDNATRHPWGVQVFVDLFLREGDPGAALYAEELLHVCRVSLGRPDRLSAWILLDAADCLGEG